MKFHSLRGRDRGAFAMRAALLYAAAAFAWIFVSDDVLAMVVPDPARHAFFQTLKGAAFVSVTAALLYFALLRAWLERDRAVLREERAGRRLGALLRHVPGMAYRCRNDERWTMLFVSEGCRELTGVPASDLLHNRRAAYADLIVPEDRRRVQEAVQAALRRRRRFRIEYRIRTPAGVEKWVWEQGRGVRGESGRDLIEGFITDISEQKRTEQQFHQAQKLEAVGRLAGGVAHDFNNILTSILGSAQILLEDLSPGSPAREEAEQIRRGARRAAELTAQLLSFSRRRPAEPRVVELGAAMREFERMLRRVLGEDVALVVRVSADPARARIDPGRLEQAIMNLAVNARDAMSSGGTLTIEAYTGALDAQQATSPELPPGRYAALSVRDTGSGMTPEVRDRLFEPFFTTKEPGKGTGLGLSSVYGVVRQAGGGIHVYSEPGRGTIFKLYFPLAEPGEPAPAEEAPAPRRRAGGELILLVEDEEGVRRTVARMLERGGYRVAAAAAPEEALELFAARREEIRLVLTDTVMPGGGGRELARRLRSAAPGLPILFMSGYAEADPSPAAGEESPGGRVLEKPISTEALLDAVSRAL